MKDADREIIRHLKETGALRAGRHRPQLPLRYRQTPLIYRAVPSWYVKVEQLKDRLLAANGQVRWVPDHIQEGRFGKWLDGARIGRSPGTGFGYAAAPWVNDETGAVHCIGSQEELAALTGTLVDDLHRSRRRSDLHQGWGVRVYRRVPEVLDCWFESGSMPYAQLHYLRKQRIFEQGFPAEFIAEGLTKPGAGFTPRPCSGGAV